MKYEYATTFIKDVKKLSPQLRSQVQGLIEEIDRVNQLDELSNVKKIKGCSNAFRIRMGEYRIGIFIENKTVVLARMLHRREIYRYFP